MLCANVPSCKGNMHLVQLRYHTCMYSSVKKCELLFLTRPACVSWFQMKDTWFIRGRYVKTTCMCIHFVPQDTFYQFGKRKLHACSSFQNPHVSSSVLSKELHACSSFQNTHVPRGIFFWKNYTRVVLFKISMFPEAFFFWKELHACSSFQDLHVPRGILWIELHV
jgi:hypothetical protein